MQKLIKLHKGVKHQKTLQCVKQNGVYQQQYKFQIVFHHHKLPLYFIVFGLKYIKPQECCINKYVCMFQHFPMQSCSAVHFLHVQLSTVISSCLGARLHCAASTDVKQLLKRMVQCHMWPCAWRLQCIPWHSNAGSRSFPGWVTFNYPRKKFLKDHTIQR